MPRKRHWPLLLTLFLAVLTSCVISGEALMSEPNSATRVPAEWEPHAATWMQWPGQWEAQMRPAFANIIKVVQDYEPVHLLTSSPSEQAAAQQFLDTYEVPATNLTWHIVPIDNSWLRDNGPVYVTDDSDLWIQNWQFDAWGGNFGADIPYVNDNKIPAYIGQRLGMRVEDHLDYILERGNLEFNGADTLVLNWDCQDDRNPGLEQAEHEAILTAAFGVSHIIWAYGHHPEDGTTGHIDGTARFVDRHTLVVADYEGSTTERELAIAAEAAGLTVIRYPGDPNWLVGNGFVAAMASGDSSTDAQLKAQLESLFPDRDIYMIDASAIADAGGGIHCVTNDQPASV
jgi:agmatine deiminase